MLKRVKYFVWFCKVSPDFMNKSLWYLIRHDHLILRGLNFVRYMVYDDKMTKKHGADNWYAMSERSIYF